MGSRSSRPFMPRPPAFQSIARAGYKQLDDRDFVALHSYACRIAMRQASSADDGMLPERQARQLLHQIHSSVPDRSLPTFPGVFQLD